MSSMTEVYEDPSAQMRQDALAPGEALLGGQYHIQSYLASGGFGITYLAIDSLDRKVVIKECYPEVFCCRQGTAVEVRSSSMTEDFLTIVRHFKREALRLAKLSHPNIVGVHQVFEDNGTAYMALDFIDGRDLMSLIEDENFRLSPEAIKAMLITLLEAVGYIHDHKVLHRDISPDNILIDQTGNPVLIDFGAAHDVAPSSSRALSVLQVVKDGYSPQESYLAGVTQSESSDLYSIAATFYHLITGDAPPDSQARVAALASDRPDPCSPIPPRESGYDQFFLGALDSALAVFPEQRPQSAQDWIDMIEEKRRREALKAKAHQDKQIELDIKFLTAETNLEILGKPKANPAPVPVPRRITPVKRVAPAAPQPAKPAPAPERKPIRVAKDEMPDLSDLKPGRKRSLFDRLLSRSEPRRKQTASVGLFSDRRGA
jgi:serine/threonine protein kinase